MKTLLKIIFAPVIAVMWILIKIGSLITYISGLALGVVSGIFGVISVIFLLTGSTQNGLIGLVIAYLLSPYGIPMFTILLLGIIQKVRFNLQEAIYG